MRRLESLLLIALGKTFITKDAIKVEVFFPLSLKVAAMKLKEGKIKLKKPQTTNHPKKSPKFHPVFKLEPFFKGRCPNKKKKKKKKG